MTISALPICLSGFHVESYKVKAKITQYRLGQRLGLLIEAPVRA